MNNEALDVLHNAGLKATPQRIAVYDFLRTSTDHPTAADIHSALSQQYPSLSLSTVYNTLDALVAGGIVNALGNVKDGRVRFDGNTSPHINLACIQCGNIIDFPSHLTDQLSQSVAGESGFRITNTRFVFQGICPDCAKLSS